LLSYNIKPKHSEIQRPMEVFQEHRLGILLQTLRPCLNYLSV